MQGNLLINFKSFHSKEKDNRNLNLLLLHFQVSALQVLLPTYIMLVTSVLPSAEMPYQTLFPKSWFFQGYFEKQKYSRIARLQSKPGQ